MKRYAVVRGGAVFTVTETDDEALAQSGGWVECDTTVQVGDLWDGSAFSRPAPAVPVPHSVTRRQARQALLLAGLLDGVQPAIDAIADATQRALAQIEWDDSQEIQRNRPILIQLAAAMGLSSEDLDALFVTAAGL